MFGIKMNRLVVDGVLARKYKLGKTIGQGRFGKVKRAVALDGQEYAVKIVNKASLDWESENKMERETAIMKELDHPFVVKVHAVYDEDDFSYVVMDLITGGELFDYIVAHGKASETDARRFFAQLVLTVGYCHSKGVIHRDLKPENILLDSEQNIKVIDFGLSNVLNHPEDLLRTQCGSPHYAAPEIGTGEGYGKSVDLWSLGVILHGLLLGRLPFNGATYSAIVNNIRSKPVKIPSSLSPLSAHLLRRLLQPEVKNRATMAEVIAHPWVDMRSLKVTESMLQSNIQPSRIEREAARIFREQLAKQRPTAPPAPPALPSAQRPMPAVQQRPRSLSMVIRRTSPSKGGNVRMRSQSIGTYCPLRGHDLFAIAHHRRNHENVGPPVVDENDRQAIFAHAGRGYGVSFREGPVSVSAIAPCKHLGGDCSDESLNSPKRAESFAESFTQDPGSSDPLKVARLFPWWRQRGSSRLRLVSVAEAKRLRNEAKDAREKVIRAEEEAERRRQEAKERQERLDALVAKQRLEESKRQEKERKAEAKRLRIEAEADVKKTWEQARLVEKEAKRRRQEAEQLQKRADALVAKQEQEEAKREEKERKAEAKRLRAEAKEAREQVIRSEKEAKRHQQEAEQQRKRLDALVAKQEQEEARRLEKERKAEAKRLRAEAERAAKAAREQAIRAEKEAQKKKKPPEKYTGGAFGQDCSSTLPPLAMVMEIENALNAKGVTFSHPGGNLFMFNCTFKGPLSTVASGAQGMTHSVELSFSLEICRLGHLELHTILFTRILGATFDHKILWDSLRHSMTL